MVLRGLVISQSLDAQNYCQIPEPIDLLECLGQTIKVLDSQHLPLPPVRCRGLMLLDRTT